MIKLINIPKRIDIDLNRSTNVCPNLFSIISKAKVKTKYESNIWVKICAYSLTCQSNIAEKIC